MLNYSTSHISEHESMECHVSINMFEDDLYKCKLVLILSSQLISLPLQWVIRGCCKLLCSNGHLDRSRWLVLKQVHFFLVSDKQHSHFFKIVHRHHSKVF